MNPMQAMANRTARLAAEAAKPVYSISTGQTNPFIVRAMAQRDLARGRYAEYLSDYCGCGDC